MNGFQFHGHRQACEDDHRKQLALAAAGEAVSLERQWLARAQLGGLLVAEWRLDEAREQGGKVHGGEPLPGSYVRPALVEMPAQSAVMVRETFAPVLYVLRYRDLDEALELSKAAVAGDLAVQERPGHVGDVEALGRDHPADVATAHLPRCGLRRRTREAPDRRDPGVERRHADLFGRRAWSLQLPDPPPA